MAKINVTHIIDSINKFINKLKEEAFRIDAVYLYGSYAKGMQHKWSDIDIAIISPDFSEDNFDEMVRLSIIAAHIDSRIEPVLFNPDTFVDEDPLAWEIKKEGIAIMPEIVGLIEK